MIIKFVKTKYNGEKNKIIVEKMAHININHNFKIGI